MALRPNLKVLYTSGYTENAIARLDPGVRLLAKPSRRTELTQMEREALEDADVRVHLRLHLPLLG